MAAIRLTIDTVNGVTSLCINGPLIATLVISTDENTEIELFDYTDKVILHNKLLNQNMEDL